MWGKAWVIGVIVLAAVSVPVLLALVVFLATYIAPAPDYAELLEQPRAGSWYARSS
jgi:hypothetical protein